MGRKSNKYLIDDRMKALDLNEQVLLKRRITIMHVDDVKALDIAHVRLVFQWFHCSCKIVHMISLRSWLMLMKAQGDLNGILRMEVN